MIQQLIQLALSRLESDPNFQKELQNNPTKRTYYEVLKSGDAKRGEEIANGLINTYGADRNQACQQAINMLQGMNNYR